MILKRFFLLLLLAVAAQGVWFWYHYSDLLALRSPASVLAESPETFRGVAAKALQRPQLTRRHLERLAETAALTSDVDIEITARQRLWQLAPGEAPLGLQLADALRRGKRTDEAARVYQAILSGKAGGQS